MKLNVFIAKLRQIKNEHGNLEVDTDDQNGARISHAGPTVAFRKILEGRETKPKFFTDSDLNSKRGDKVCRV